MKVFHSGVVDTAGLGNSHLLRTTWWMGDVALSGVLLGRGALSREVVRVVTIEAGMAGGGSSGRWRRQARHGRPRCSAPTGDSMRERWRLRRTRWGGGVLTRDDRRRWSEENGLMRWCSRAVAELRWPGRGGSMSPAAGGGDRGGEAWSKRVGRRGCGRAHRGGRMVWRREDGTTMVVLLAGVDMMHVKERRGAMERSGARSRGRTRGERKKGAATGSPL
jgi:hypothetical protein